MASLYRPLLLALSFLVLAHHSHAAPGYTIKRLPQIPENSELSTLPSTDIRGNRLEVEATPEPGSNNCRARIFFVAADTMHRTTITQWSARFCDLTYSFFLTSGNIFIIHPELNGSGSEIFKLEERTVTGASVAEHEIEVGDGPDSFDAGFDSIQALKNDTIGVSLSRKRNTRVVVYRDGSFLSLDFEGRLELDSLKPWGEMLLSGYEESIVAKISDGSIVKRYSFTVSDFNSHHEVIGLRGDSSRDEVVVSRRGRFRLSECAFPNSFRLDRLHLVSIDERGVIYGFGKNLDDSSELPVRIKYGANGYDGRFDYCPVVNLELLGQCAEALYQSGDFFIPPTEDKVIRDPLICSTRVTIKSSSGLPLAGLRAVVRNENSPYETITSGVTDSKGSAFLTFSLGGRQSGVKVNAPYVDQRYHSKGYRVSKYRNDGP